MILQLKINTNFNRKFTFQCPGRIEFFSGFNEFIFNNYIMKCENDTETQRLQCHQTDDFLLNNFS